jgi:O-antigen/teichoic acid export membrane protein
VAIAIPERDRDAANLLALAVSSATLVTAVLAICVYSMPHQIALWLRQPTFEPYLWLLPIGVAFAALSSALQFWFVRRGEFPTIARARVGQSLAVAGTQVGFGLLHIVPVGLLIGQVLNSGVSCIALGCLVVRREMRHLRSISLRNMKSAFSTYSQFPKFSTFEALSNSAASHLPVLLIARFTTGPEVGFLIFAMYVIQAPMGLIGGAIAQVYLSRAPTEFRAGRIAPFTTTVLGGLLQAGVGPIIFAGIVAPDLFSIVFGEEWQRAGVLVSWMAPWFVLQFLSFPVSAALPVTSQQRVSLLLMLFGLATRVAFVCVAWFVLRGWVSEAYALSGFAFYAAYLAVVLRVVSASRAEIVAQVLKALPMVLGWTVAGVLVVLAIRAIA